MFSRKVQIVINILFLSVLHNITAQVEKPNVLMIVMDDLNDYVGVLEGHPQAKTPNIDALANEGVLFTNAHSNSPLCKPSRASFLSGLLPTTTKFFGNQKGTKWTDNELIKNSNTISEYFSKNGYTTYKTGKVSHSGVNDDKRWDHVLENSLDYGPFAFNGNETVIHPETVLAYAAETGPLDGTLARLSEIPNVLPDGTNPGYHGWWSSSSGTPFYYNNPQDRDLMPDEVSVQWTQNNIATLDNSNSTAPFFMTVGIVRPHSPFVVPDKYFDLFPIDQVQIPVIQRGDKADTFFGDDKTGYLLYDILDDSYTDRQYALRKKTQAYLACVAFVDDMVGQLLTSLKNSSYANNTVVMLFSDHGYHIGEKEYLRKHTLWDESTRVPLIIKHPDFTFNAGKRVNHPVSLIDIYPTLKDLCNLSGDTKKNENGSDLDGYSLKPFIENPETLTWEGPETAITHVYNWGYFESDEQNFSLRSKRYRYTLYPNGTEELYDHLHDPYEWKNLYNTPAYNEVKTTMNRELTQRITAPGTPQIIMTDHLVNGAKISEISNNFNFVTIAETDLTALDPEQLQRSNKNEAYIVYDLTDAHSFEIDFWGTKNHSLEEAGTLKAFIAGADKLYSEIPLNYTEDPGTTGYRKRYTFSSNTALNGSKHLKITVSDGSASWIALLGKVTFYDDGLQNNSPTNIEAIEVDVPNDIFDFDTQKLRTNASGAPNFTDNLDDNSLMYRTDGAFYFSTIESENYDGDTGRLVRSKSVTDQLSVVYQAPAAKYFRLEYWVKNANDATTAQMQSGNLNFYTSSNGDIEENYISVSLKFLKIKKANDWTLFAVTPQNEFEENIQFLKFTVDATGSNNWLGQYGAMHIYNTSLNKGDELLSVEKVANDAFIKIYPNPVQDELKINAAGQQQELQIAMYNSMGTLVLTKQTSHSTSILDTSQLPAGVYFVNILSNGILYTKKLIKN